MRGYPLCLVLIFVLCTLMNTNAEQTYKFCGQKLEDMKSKVCSFGHESAPCFKDGLRLGSSAAQTLVNKCCKSSGCTMSELSAQCCQKDACLQSCYPGKGYKIGQVY